MHEPMTMPPLTLERITAILNRYKQAPDYDISTRELLPLELRQLLPSLKSTELVSDNLCLLRLLHLATRSQWLVVSGSPTKYRDYKLFAHVTINGNSDLAEWGHISYAEINDMNRIGGTRGPFPGRVEVDISFEPCVFSRVRGAL